MAGRAGRARRLLPWPGAQLGSVARRQAKRPGRAGCLGLTGVLGGSEACTRLWRRGGEAGPRSPPGGKARRTAVQRRLGGGAGPGPAGCALLLSGLGGDSSKLVAPLASRCPPRLLDRDLVKGLALFPLLLSCSGGLRSPLSLGAAAPLKRLGGSESGALEVPAVGGIFPFPPCPPLYAVDAPPVLSPWGLGPWGRASAFLSLPRCGVGKGPHDLPGRSERDV